MICIVFGSDKKAALFSWICATWLVSRLVSRLASGLASLWIQLSIHVSEGPSPAPTSEAGLQNDLGPICSRESDLISKPKCLVSRGGTIQSQVIQMTHNAWNEALALSGESQTRIQSADWPGTPSAKCLTNDRSVFVSKQGPNASAETGPKAEADEGTSSGKLNRRWQRHWEQRNQVLPVSDVVSNPVWETRSFRNIHTRTQSPHGVLQGWPRRVDSKRERYVVCITRARKKHKKLRQILRRQRPANTTSPTPTTQARSKHEAQNHLTPGASYGATHSERATRQWPLLRPRKCGRPSRSRGHTTSKATLSSLSTLATSRLLFHAAHAGPLKSKSPYPTNPPRKPLRRPVTPCGTAVAPA